MFTIKICLVSIKIKVVQRYYIFYSNVILNCIGSFRLRWKTLYGTIVIHYNVLQQ